MRSKTALTVFLGILSIFGVHGQCRINEWEYYNECLTCAAGNYCPDRVHLYDCPPGYYCTVFEIHPCADGTSSLINDNICVELDILDQYDCKMVLEHWDGSKCVSNLIDTQIGCSVSPYDCDKFTTSLYDYATEITGVNYVYSGLTQDFGMPFQGGCVSSNGIGTPGRCMGSCGKDKTGTGDFISRDTFDVFFFSEAFSTLTSS
jgi:hypothetical protein